MRNIKPELIAFIDDKLKNNGSAQYALREGDARSLFIYAAEACVGQMEKGVNSGYFVELCQRTVDNYAGGEAWCMAFIESMLSYVEHKLGVTSPVFSSEHCLTVWQNTPDEQRVRNRPLPGAIIIWRHGNTSNGHTGIVTEFLGDKMLTVEGNTGNGSFREGDGVYQKKRSTNMDGDMRVMGFLIPFTKLAV